VRSRSPIYNAIRLVLLAAIVGYLLWQVYAGREALLSLRPQWEALSLAGAFVAAVFAYQCLFLGWVMLLRRSGHYHSDNTRSYLRIWWVSYLYRYVPGKVLLVVERARMGSAVGIPAAAGAALTIVETLLAVLAGSAVSLLAISYYAAGDEPLLFGVAAIAVGAIFVFPAGFRLLCGLPFVRQRYPELETVSLSSRDVLASVLPYVAHYLLLGLSFFLLSRSLQVFGWTDLAGLCGIYALSHVISLIALIAPGGLGVREGALAVQLGRILPTGVAEALAIGVRIWFTLIELLCYFAVLVFCASKSDRLR
jgi:hypothetical protein